MSYGTMTAILVITCITVLVMGTLMHMSMLRFNRDTRIPWLTKYHGEHDTAHDEPDPVLEDPLFNEYARRNTPLLVMLLVVGSILCSGTDQFWTYIGGCIILLFAMLTIISMVSFIIILNRRGPSRESIIDGMNVVETRYAPIRQTDTMRSMERFTMDTAHDVGSK